MYYRGLTSAFIKILFERNIMITEKDLSVRNYYLVVDRSGSMSESVSKDNTTSRWDSVKEYAISFAKECEKKDPDGIDIYLFNKTFTLFANTTADKIVELFEKNGPMGGTDFVPVLTDVFNKHFAGDKASTVLVFTDGEPSDGDKGKKALSQLIIDTANKLEADAELAVSFLQVGRDPKASEFLKSLDDNLVNLGAKFDIVDTKTCDELDSLTIDDVLLAAVND
jgi:hypothetical protein